MHVISYDYDAMLFYIVLLFTLSSDHAVFNSSYSGCKCPQTTVTVTVLSVILSLVLTLLLSTCAVNAVVHAVMYKRLQRCRAELRGGELCSTPQLSQSILWSRAAASLLAGGGDSVKVGPEEEWPSTREEEEEGEKMQANPAYLPIEMMSYNSQESKHINTLSWSDSCVHALYST